MTETGGVGRPAVPWAGLPGDPGGTLEAGRATPREAARQLETMFLSMLLKELRQSAQADGSDGLFAGDTADVYGGMFDQFLGQHLAAAGGIGLASVWAAQLDQAPPPERPYHVTAARPAVAGPGLD